tara:strand:- start:469 stop:702 length:234 start_codon:yes stop_codon:yes gene_type:complete
MGSKRFSLNGVDLISMCKGLLIAAGGAALTYISEWASGSDFGILTPLITAGLAVVVNAFRKFVTDGSSDEQPAEPAA